MWRNKTHKTGLGCLVTIIVTNLFVQTVHLPPSHCSALPSPHRLDLQITPYLYSCTASLEQTPACAMTNIRSISRTHQNLTSRYLSTGLPLKTENTVFSQILSLFLLLPSPPSPFQL